MAASSNNAVVALSTGLAMTSMLVVMVVTHQSMAPSASVEVIPVNMPDAADIERSVTAFARGANGGLILTASGSAFVHHDLIIALAARHKLPAVYFERFFVAKGGLISYGSCMDGARGARGI